MTRKPKQPKEPPEIREYCWRCKTTQPCNLVQHAMGTVTECAVCGARVDFWPDDDEYYGFDGEDCCPTCGGEGFAEYNDCPEAWGEDCPSEVNHLVVCPNCKGSGRIEDCDCV